MSRPIKHAKTGVYWLRKRVPSDLCEKIGRSVVTKSLGTKDPAEARQKHAELLAELEAQWASLRLGDRMVTDRDAHFLANTVGEEWLITYRDNPSHQLLWHPDIYEGMWTRFPLPDSEAGPGIPGSAPIANFFWKAMRDHCLSEAQRLLGDNGFSRDNWSLYKTARAVGAALQKASLELRRQEHGEFPPGDEPVALSQRFDAPSTTSAGQNARASISAPNALSSPTLMDLVNGWWREGQAAGLKPSTYESYHNTFKNFVRFLGHDRSGDVGVKEVVAFKDHRLSTPSSRTGKIPSAKTVKHSDLSALKAVFDWAVRNGHMDSNPATTVTIKLAKPARLRSKGFTNAEAVAILKAATEHQNDREHKKTCAAKRWIPWLCAFTGARVGELGQLRKQDVRLHDGIWTIIITPEAGTVKTNEAREVPIHQEVIDLGFLDFVDGAPAGHLFLNVQPTSSPLRPLQALKNRLAEFSRTIVSDRGVAPNHGWRHRFKTVGMEAGIPPRILDAIQGQAPRTVADTYGDVTLKTMAAELAKLPNYDVNRRSS